METPEIIPSTTVAAEQPVIPQKAEKKGGKRIGYYYIILKSLKKSRKNDVVKCFYIKGLTKFGLCVIKEGSFGESRDNEGRDIRDRLKWQEELHERLQDKVRMPGLLGSFEENGNYYLVMDYIKGKPLYRFFKSKGVTMREHLLAGDKTAVRFFGYMIQLVDILDALHKHHIVHRDVTPSNFMVTPGGRVAVIDMELSYSLKDQFPAPPFQLGTIGYMSPEQESMQAPTVLDDVFSVGAIMLNAFTGISPGKLIRDKPEVIRERVDFFIPDRQLAAIILQCLHPEPLQRTGITALRSQLAEYRAGMRKRTVQPTVFFSCLERERLPGDIQDVIRSLSTPLFCDPGKGWFADNLRSGPEEKHQLKKAWYASFSHGASGIMYLLAQAKRVGLDVSANSAGIEEGARLMDLKYLQRAELASPGLHSGSYGVAVSLLAAVRHELGISIPGVLQKIPALLDIRPERLGYAQGLAGQGVACLICSPVMEPVVLQKKLSAIAAMILEKQQADGSWNVGKNEKESHFTRGFTKGAAGIIYFLLEYAAWSGSAEAEGAAMKGLHWLEQKATHRAGLVRWDSSEGKPLSSWWAEGVAGIALPFMKAYQLYGNNRYKSIATGALHAVARDTVNNSLSQYEGLAGLGEVYLEAFSALKDEAWLERAFSLGEVITRLRKTDPRFGPYWLVEHERQPTAAFMTGNAGVLHFLLRCSYPEQLSFPLLV